MRKHTPQQTEQDFQLVKRSFYFLRDIVGMSLEDIANFCDRNPGTINQYRCNTRTTPPEVREKLTELAKLRGYDPRQEMRVGSEEGHAKLENKFSEL
ncbi:MAG TPA: hypothetical protein PKJ72_07270 [Deltaproteobacteria bacterium]|nr:hypothetical protein [Deltaproteobacteria bacterium]HNS89832.1 hypothetical protein [Deltaproteobacteria bacterium]HOY75066.1 hypothetical protein [Deltaproteobacteria bacterium]HQM71994.1 hypothetical protein [Deltaproteobacteria bacterium]